MDSSTLGYTIGVAIVYMAFAAPISAGAFIVTKKVTKYRVIKTFGVGLLGLFICILLGGFKQAIILDILIICVEIALCVYVINRRNLAKDKKNQTKGDEGINVG